MPIKDKHIGVYIHIPFCDGKCNYCNFYSLPNSKNFEEYIKALIKEIKSYSNKHINVDTVYFGGGTPGLIGSKNLAAILNAVKNSFSVTDTAEITTELNPNGLDDNFFSELKSAGFNRISFGMQTSNDNELKLLGRKHSKNEIEHSVQLAKNAGFKNISVDLMLGVPESTQESVVSSIHFAASLNIQHISAYMLKIEKGTPFYKQKDSLNIPDDDDMAEIYSACIKELEKAGFQQYEISNFSKTGFESQHNLKYWRCEEYLGFGPSAHSFFDGKRFFYPSNISSFISGASTIQDGTGGDFKEFAMLKLRLSEGLSIYECKNKFKNGEVLFLNLLKNTSKCPKNLINFDDHKISLTAKGFAVSNAVILTLIDFDNF